MKAETEYSIIKVVILFILILTIDCFIRDEVFTASLEIIKHLQQTYRIEWLLKYVHYLVSAESYVVIFCVSVQAMDLQHSFIIFGAQGFAYVIFSLLKQMIRAPRPFFIDTDIVVDACKYAEFGSPSGHSFAGGIIYTNLTILLLKYYKCSRRTQFFSFTQITVPIIGILGFSRIYEGMHSID